MEYVLYNGNYYCGIAESGKIVKTLNIDEAHKFTTPSSAREKRKKAPGKLAYYYVWGIDNGKLFKVSKKQKRKTYSDDVRKMIYNHADGRCYLCGRKILYKDMTLDHVLPLAMGGADEVENLSCSCLTCNQFKGSILSDSFMERISDIFIYQMEKKCCANWKWKIIRKMLLKLSVTK